MTNDQILEHQLLRDFGAQGHLRLDPWRRIVIGARRTVGHASMPEPRNLHPCEVRALLLADMAMASETVRQHLPWATDEEIGPPRRAVLVGLVISPGDGWAKTFRATIAAMHDGDWPDAAAELLRVEWPEEELPRARRLAAQLELGSWI